jgi:putative membrane protein
MSNSKLRLEYLLLDGLFFYRHEWRFTTMLFKWFLATLHLLAYGVALGAVLSRGRSLRRLNHTNPSKLRDVFVADNFWGIAVAVLLVTGALRAFGGFEKGTFYYLHQPLFHLKMTAFIAIILLEVAPMIALIKWRNAFKNGTPIDTRRAKLYSQISHIEVGLIIVILVAAAGMARGAFIS